MSLKKNINKKIIDNRLLSLFDPLLDVKYKGLTFSGKTILDSYLHNIHYNKPNTKFCSETIKNSGCHCNNWNHSISLCPLLSFCDIVICFDNRGDLYNSDYNEDKEYNHYRVIVDNIVNTLVNDYNFPLYNLEMLEILTKKGQLKDHIIFDIGICVMINLSNDCKMYNIIKLFILCSNRSGLYLPLELIEIIFGYF